jgi:hypothetical protein
VPVVERIKILEVFPKRAVAAAIKFDQDNSCPKSEPNDVGRSPAVISRRRFFLPVSHQHIDFLLTFRARFDQKKFPKAESDADFFGTSIQTNPPGVQLLLRFLRVIFILLLWPRKLRARCN